MTANTLVQLPASGRPFVAGTRFSLSSGGYMQAEYALSGRALAYSRTAGGFAVAGEDDFATRLLVFRPADPARFNGTVWMEWLNVSGGLDASPDWVFAHTQLMRSGAAWIGVSAQRAGVEGGEGVLGMPSVSLRATDPGRYGRLHHPGDRFSYDIFTQAGAVARGGWGTILDGLPVDRVLALGESQSAFRLTTYVNDIDPLSGVYDGFLIHARGAGSAPLHDDGPPAAAGRGDVTSFSGDLRVPVLCVESETDLIQLGYVAARQDDAENLVLWEMAGTSHGDIYTFVAGPIDSGRLAIEDLAGAWRPTSDVYGIALARPVNAGPQHYVMNAAVDALDGWVRHDMRPPAADRLAVADGVLVLDRWGNARGGIRTPHVDVPTAVLSGLGNDGHALAVLCGTTTAFDDATLVALYGSKEGYVERHAAATAAAVARGFVLAADAPEITAIAAHNAPF
ncbi:MAG: alpha/beta hydrolase domain-containing protein [Acidimicrobiales bacterium]